MNSIKDICGTVEYTNTIPLKGIVECHAIWTIPNFIDLLNNKDIAALTTQASSACAEGSLQLRMKFERTEDKVDLWYLSPKLLYLQSVQLMSSYFDVNNWAFVKEENIVGKAERQIVKVNMWYYINSLSSKGSYYLQDRQGQNKIINMKKNGSLRLKFVFVITETEEDQYQIPAPQLINDFENLLLEGIFSDVIMKSAEGDEFKVHKAVLASRSAVLRAHFEHNTTESITNIVESPLESEVLHEVLSFIYTDKIAKLCEMPKKLMAAADYYQLTRLKSLCEEVLYKKLTVDNAIDTLQFADLHSANTLKELTVEFIKDRQSLVTKTQCWTKLQSIDLMRTICE